MRCLYKQTFIQKSLHYKDDRGNSVQYIDSPLICHSDPNWSCRKWLTNIQEQILLRIFSPIRIGDLWRNKRNTKLYTMLRDAEAVIFIKLACLQRARHVQRSLLERIQEWSKISRLRTVCRKNLDSFLM